MLYISEQTAELNEHVKEMRKDLDRIQLNLYNEFRPEIRNLKGISITDIAGQHQFVVKVGKFL